MTASDMPNILRERRLGESFTWLCQWCPLLPSPFFAQNISFKATLQREDSFTLCERILRENPYSFSARASSVTRKSSLFIIHEGFSLIFLLQNWLGKWKNITSTGNFDNFRVLTTFLLGFILCLLASRLEFFGGERDPHDGCPRFHKKWKSWKVGFCRRTTCSCRVVAGQRESDSSSTRRTELLYTLLPRFADLNPGWASLKVETSTLAGRKRYDNGARAGDANQNAGPLMKKKS